MTTDFNHTAEDYHVAVPTIPDELPEKLLRLGNLRAESMVVELGCGSGHLALALATKGMKVIGIDRSAKLIGIARSRDTSHVVEWITGRAEEYIPTTGLIDMYVAFEAFHLFEDKSAAIILAERHLRPGGTLCVGWCEYHWEAPLKEEIAEAFGCIGLPWGDWDYYTCPNFPGLVAERCHSMSPVTLTTFEVATRTNLRQIAAFLTSIGKVTNISLERRMQLRRDLETRFFSRVGADLLSGESKYYLSWCKRC